MTIAEVCKRFSLTADTLRYYERVGLIPGVSRTSGGIRDYTEQDCNWIGFIKCMRSSGVQVEALIQYVTLFQQGDATSEARKQILIDQRDQIAARLTDMQKTLDRLNGKIARYERDIVSAEKELKITSKR